MQVIKSIRLTLVEGKHYKEYRVQIEDDGGTYSVRVFWGKIGSTLRPTLKGEGLTLDAAEKKFTSIVNGQTRDGYTPDDSSEAVVENLRERTDTGLRPQLLTPIDEDELERYITDPNFVLQRKHNGERLMVTITDGNAEPSNRNGMATTIPKELQDELAGFPDIVIDGEIVRGEYYVFDLLEVNGVNYRNRAYDDRLDQLATHIPSNSSRIFAVKTYFTEEEKRDAIALSKIEKWEGFVLKHISAPYTPGRPSSGGPQLKFKHWKSASCIVAGQNGSKRSVQLELIEDGERVFVGHCTVKANQTIPEPGTIVEVQYLMIAAKGASLQQPELLDERHDITLEECTTDQLIYGSG